MSAEATAAREGGFVGAWNRFWFQEVPVFSLSLFRLLFALCMFYELSFIKKNMRFAIEGGFHLPYTSLIPNVSEGTYNLIFAVQYPLIIMFGVGILARVAGSILLFLQCWMFFNDYLNFLNHPYLFILILFLLLISPANDAVSLRRLHPVLTGRGSLDEAFIGPDRPITIQRIIQIQICIVYLLAGFQKMSWYFLDGHVLVFYLKNAGFFGFLHYFFDPETAASLKAWMLTPQGETGAAWVTLIAELALPFALWFRKTRQWAILFGIFFHAALGVLMHVWAFSAAMIATYLLFLDPQTMPRIFRRTFNLK